jgi:hypothetical protein
MIIHTIVYVILSILSVTAVYAASMPISKEQAEEQQAPESDKDTDITL